MDPTRYFPKDPAGFLTRKEFGKDFLFGSSTSAFQIEGGSKRDNRGTSIFDTFAKKRDLFAPYSEDAVNHREHYKEDVKLMNKIGFDAYRFSISWCRIMPTGKKESRNQAGIDFYKDLLKNLKAEKIEPIVTLLHFDPPQNLEDEYNTFLNRAILDDFCDYAEICFQEFGQDVKHWITINEPWSVAYGGYVIGELPPGYKTKTDYEAIQRKRSGKSYVHDDHASLSPPIRRSIKSSWTEKPSATDYDTPKNEKALPAKEKWPYLAAHNQILAHAKAARLYKEKYQKDQGGKIGLNLVTEWYLPYEDTAEDKEAVKRAVDFMFGWFMDPLFRGDYPMRMRLNVTECQLPHFGDDKGMVKGSYDFISLNYYTTRYVSNEETGGGDYVLDRRVKFYDKKDGKDISPVQGAGGWVHGYPRGLLELLLYIKKNYGDPEIYITENGIDDLDDDSMSHWDSFQDQKRTLYLHDHLSYIKKALQQGVKIKGHFVWSFLDNLELNAGFKYRFGIVYVDYEDKDQKRTQKSSNSWYNYFLKHEEINLGGRLKNLPHHIDPSYVPLVE